MQKIVVGILAHVDAGKTTLSEALLYETGNIRKMGRVDNKDAYLDTYQLEKERGITIFSKQAIFTLEDMQITLLDTPGHVDFCAEMERTLQVLDYAILVINGADGVQGHTYTLWQLLQRYKIPAFVFVNKMDQNGTDKEKLFKQLRERLSENCIDFTAENTSGFYESLALTEESSLEQFLETGKIDKENISELILSRKVFPCFFGSALKLQGIKEFIAGIKSYAKQKEALAEFGGKIYKISRDSQGNRLTFLKLTAGTLKVKAAIGDEKINQLRKYSGEKFEAVNEVEAGDICAVTGLNETYPGQGLGIERDSQLPILQPVLTYKLELPEGYDAGKMLTNLRQLEEEDPQLHVIWNESLLEIQVRMMGEVQIEILKSLIEERFGVAVEFHSGSIIYAETISDTVEGVGHFEPLRHYAEVHLVLEPAQPGSGLHFEADCSEELLARNWQRLILTHLEEKEHRGVLARYPITDMKITLRAGRAHQKHTEGGDFRQATYRAVRQGLMQAKSVLLEPYYEFQLEVPEKMLGRALADIEKMYGTCTQPEQEGGIAILKGRAPVATMQSYHSEVLAYTKGFGRLSCVFGGYAPCHNAAEVIEKVAYDPNRDMENLASSVFCAHGAGFVVEWNKVKEYMHLESILEEPSVKGEEDEKRNVMNAPAIAEWIDDEEIEAIYAKTFYANKHDKSASNSWRLKSHSKSHSSNYIPPTSQVFTKQEKKEEYLLVDGYNIIFAWEELKELAEINIDSARGRLLDILSNYQGIKDCTLIVVFDAYRVERREATIQKYQNIHVVFTKTAETADQYIEKFAYQNKDKYKITVATSDGLEQIIISGQGCNLYSAREFYVEVQQTQKKIREEYIEKQQKGRIFLLDSFSEESIEDIKDNLNE